MSVVISGLKLDKNPTQEKKFKLIARLHAFSQKQTSKKANSQLEWSEEFEFISKPESTSLRISIRDKHNTTHSKKGEFLGRASVPIDLASKGKTENWYTLNPRKRDPNQQISCKLRIIVDVRPKGDLKEDAPEIKGVPKIEEKKKENENNEEEEPEENMHELLQKFQQASQNQTKAREWEIKPASLELDRKLGEGATSTVYKGTYNQITVAVKVVKDQLSQEVLNDFRKEADLLLKIQGEGFVTCYGAYTDPTLLLVLEYCSRGSVDDVLEQNTIPFDWDRVFDFAQQAGRALYSLHTWNPPIVHRDFKPSNLLVTEDWAIKIADFGLSRFISGTNQEATLKKVKGTVAYTAPEVLSSLGYTDKSDVYSFGVTLWELVYKCMIGVAQKPYREYTNLVSPYQVMVKVVKNQLRPTIPPSTPDEISSLISSCWSQEPSQRPSSKEVLEKLESSRIIYNANKDKWNAVRVKK